MTFQEKLNYLHDRLLMGISTDNFLGTGREVVGIFHYRNHDMPQVGRPHGTPFLESTIYPSWEAMIDRVYDAVKKAEEKNP
jgi:hypothetical protein